MSARYSRAFFNVVFEKRLELRRVTATRRPTTLFLRPFPVRARGSHNTQRIATRNDAMRRIDCSRLSETRDEIDATLRKPRANERRFSDGIEIDYRSVRPANLGERSIESAGQKPGYRKMKGRHLDKIQAGTFMNRDSLEN